MAAKRRGLRVLGVSRVRPEPDYAAPSFTSTAPTLTGLTSTEDNFPAYTPTASGNPTPVISASGLPPWLSFADGAFAATPIVDGAHGSFSITLTAANGVTPNATQILSFTVADGTP